jgi:sigma-B regulation protein RsbU (phosphoserine phosphatase)
MYISVFFGVIDHTAGKLRYSNTGHPHAFIISSDGTTRRLSAESPPLGLSDQVPGTESVPWQKGKDLLALFTDGIVDTRDPAGNRIGENAVLDVIRKNLKKAPADLVKSVFDRLERYSEGGASPDDLTMLILRT